MGLTFIIPVAFAVTIPAEALTSRLTPLILVGTFALTLFFIVLARFIWRLGLKNYSGASAFSKTRLSELTNLELPGLPHPMQQAGIEDFKRFRMGTTGSSAILSMHALPDLHPHV